MLPCLAGKAMADALVPGQQGQGCWWALLRDARKPKEQVECHCCLTAQVLCLRGSSHKSESKEHLVNSQVLQVHPQPRPCVSQAERMRQLYPLSPSHQHQIPKNKPHLLTSVCFLLFKTMNKCDLRRLVTGSNRASSRLKSSVSSP